MSVTVKKNGAPTYDQGAVVQPEYTYDNWKAQMEWNKEIANNKQGYLAVDIMPMKDFYDAGGYSFVNDYRAELASVDAAYDRAVPGYGVQGEQMAGTGLTGSGFTDYMSGQAYAARVGGQALARQNAMANSNSFRAAYNQYVQQQLQKREDNLLSVVEKAYAAGVPLANFTTIATRLGIPQADAERGYSMLEAYYSGFGTSSQKYPIPDANGSSDSATGSSTATPVGDYTIDKLDTEDAAIAGSYAQQVAQAVQEGMSVEQALNLIKGQYEDYGGVITSAIKNQMNAILTSAIDSKINQGGYVSKELLDTYAARGVFGAEGKESEQYKTLLEKGQENLASKVTAVLDAQDDNITAQFLSSLGYEVEGKTAEEIENQMVSVVDELYKNGNISQKQYQGYFIREAQAAYHEIENGKELLSYGIMVHDEKDKLGQEGYKQATEGLGVRVEGVRKFTGNKSVIMLSGRKADGTPVEQDVFEIQFSTASNKISVLEKETAGAEIGDLTYHGGEFYAFTGDAWRMIIIMGTGRNNEVTESKIDLIRDLVQRSKKAEGANYTENASKGIGQ